MLKTETQEWVSSLTWNNSSWLLPLIKGQEFRAVWTDVELLFLVQELIASSAALTISFFFFFLVQKDFSWGFWARCAQRIYFRVSLSLFWEGIKKRKNWEVIGVMLLLIKEWFWFSRGPFMGKKKTSSEGFCFFSGQLEGGVCFLDLKSPLEQKFLPHEVRGDPACRIIVRKGFATLYSTGSVA